jgi:hypothetical protein
MMSSVTRLQIGTGQDGLILTPNEESPSGPPDVVDANLRLTGLDAIGKVGCSPRRRPLGVFGCVGHRMSRRPEGRILPDQAARVTRNVVSGMASSGAGVP